MKEMNLRPYQKKAIEKIVQSLEHGKKQMAIELPVGLGKSLILERVVEELAESMNEKILIVTNDLTLKKKIKYNLLETHQEFKNINEDRIAVETVKEMILSPNEKIEKYKNIIFYDVVMYFDIYETFSWKDNTIIAFNRIGNETADRRVLPIEIVYSYSYEEAIKDGYISPAMDVRALEPAIEVFAKKLLEQQFGCTLIGLQENKNEAIWDFVVKKDNIKIWGECKSYKSQVVSPSAANSILKAVIMRKKRQDISAEDIILLIVLNKIPSFQKDEIFKRHRVIVWDIENLVFYSKNNSTLLKQLSQITYFPIDYIEGDISKEAESVGLFIVPDDEKDINEIKKENQEIERLILRLNNCESGKEHSAEFEEICEEIIRNLFEANYFNRLISQYKTNDTHFRMDLIGSLKINQNDEERLHPLWKMLVEHYNSHFVVFEFKNYSKEIDQNLIYITEKYLFNAALRNVAIIISRKGFSESAKFAAEGCLKEHGKLILSIDNNDLIEMLKLKSDKAADYILDKLESFLMEISK